MSTTLVSLARLEAKIYAMYGPTIGFMANVIVTHQQDNAGDRLLGLAALARQNRVVPASFTLDLILIDGNHVPWKELECYTEPLIESKHLNQLPDKTALTIAVASLHQDDYHKHIQRAAVLLLAHAVKSDNPRWGDYTYLSGSADGTSYWVMKERGEITNVVAYRPELDRLEGELLSA